MVYLDTEIEKHALDRHQIKSVCGFWKNIENFSKIRQILISEPATLCCSISFSKYSPIWRYLSVLSHYEVRHISKPKIARKFQHFLPILCKMMNFCKIILRLFHSTIYILLDHRVQNLVWIIMLMKNAFISVKMREIAISR